jgi:hypothetical protein
MINDDICLQFLSTYYLFYGLPVLENWSQRTCKGAVNVEMPRYFRLGGCVRFFYLCRSESKRILFASYVHISVYSQTPFICIIRFIFASKFSQKLNYGDLCSAMLALNSLLNQYKLPKEEGHFIT